MPVFERGGGGGELFASKGWNLGVFFVPSSMGLLAGLIFIIVFLLPLPPFAACLPYLTLLTLDPGFFSLYEDGLLQRRRVPYSS